MLSLKRAASDLFHFFFPARCVLCGRRLSEGERHGVLCAACYVQLPFTRYRGDRGNPVERIFWGKIPIGRAHAFMHYLPGSSSRIIVHKLKYGGRSDVGLAMGELMAHDLRGTDFFEGMDCIIPVPLACRRQRHRGYNQSEMLARGISRVTGLPVFTDAVERATDNESQTGLHHSERRANVEGIFHLCQPAQLTGRHLLLIDDVVTTGSTLISLANELTKADGVRISVLALSVAGFHGKGPVGS